ncbi:MAG TPA: hypothetical protein VGB95_05655, partial [Chitinophagales bacterium]
SAQFKVLGSAPLVEKYGSSDDIFSKACSLDDGGAALATVVENQLTFALYGSDYKMKAKKTITVSTAKGNKEELRVYAILESAQSVSLLYEVRPSIKTITVFKLCRLTFNKTDGVIAEDKVVSESSFEKSMLRTEFYFKINSSKRDYYDDGIRIGGNSIIHKEKDSNNYAILAYDKTSVTIALVDSNHQELAKATIPQISGQKVTNILDFSVVGKEEVLLVAEAGSVLYVGELKVGQQEISFTKLNYESEGKPIDAILRYSSAINSFYLLVLENMSKQSGYVVYSSKLARINRDSLSVKRKILDVAPLSAIMETTGSTGASVNTAAYAGRKKKGYSGTPDNLFVKDDGSVSVIFEDVSSERFAQGGTYTYYYYEDLGIIDFNKGGKVAGAAYIPKTIKVTDGLNKKIEEAGTSSYWNKGFKSYFYVNAEPQGFVLFNDSPQNRAKADSYQSIPKKNDPMDMNGDEAYIFKTGKNNIPTSQAIFGSEERVGFFGGADYNKKTKTLVMVTRLGEKGSAQLTWLKIE